MSPLIEPTILVQLLVFGVLLGGIYGFFALGLTIIFGVMDVINVAHGAFAVVGMYTVWVVYHTLRMSPFFGVPLAAFVMFILGTTIQRTLLTPIIDESGDQFLVTMGLLIITVAAIQITFGPTPRYIDTSLNTVGIAGVYILRGHLYVLLVAVATVAALWAFLHYTHAGRAIRATADNRESAAYLGIDVKRIDYLTFGIGAGLAGLAGALLALVQPFDPYLGNEYLTVAFVVVVLGGLRSIPGTLLSGLIVGMIHVFAAFFLPGSYYHVIVLLVFILVLLFKPTGLFGSESHA